MPPFRSDESTLTYLEQAKARREARAALAPLKLGSRLLDPDRLPGAAFPVELKEVNARIAELVRVRARLMESHGVVGV
jgi:hypothetical protein